jgi:hypothetical protein
MNLPLTEIVKAIAFAIALLSLQSLSVLNIIKQQGSIPLCNIICSIIYDQDIPKRCPSQVTEAKV